MHFQKRQKIHFCTRKKSENCISGTFKKFSCANIDFLSFLKLQKMCFFTFEIALFFPILEHCAVVESPLPQQLELNCAPRNRALHCIAHHSNSLLDEAWRNCRTYIIRTMPRGLPSSAAFTTRHLAAQ